MPNALPGIMPVTEIPGNASLAQEMMVEVALACSGIAVNKKRAASSCSFTSPPSPHDVTKHIALRQHDVSCA